MNKFITLSAAALLCFSVNAQDDNNLVKNPSFEEVKGKLKKPGSIDMATGWISNTPAKADLFSGEKEGLPISVPDNIYGSEEAQDGKNYAGIVAYSYNSKSPRTYITGELISTLEKEQLYCVKFHVSAADLSKYAVNNISAHLTKKPHLRDEKVDIVFEKQEDLAGLVFHPSNQVFNARYNWETVCSPYTANGKEKFISIGNFKDNRDTKAEKLKKLKDDKGSQISDAYYYIDNVQVYKIDSVQQCECLVMDMHTEQRQTIIYNKKVSSDGALSMAQKVENSTVYFDYANAAIDPSMIGDLDRLVTLLEENSSLKLVLVGHADLEEIEHAIRNPKLYNIDRDRVDAVVEYLTSKGIDRSRFLLKAQNSQEPADTDTTELAKAKNRRVEFVIQK
jgi:OmpA-OmpF porin, OOP family